MKVQLKVLSGSHAGKCISISRPRFVIGRGEDCQLRPNSDSVSRNHCAITVADNKVTVCDLGSRNGTHVNGTRIEGEVTVRGGDKLSIGPLEFEVLVTAPSTQPVTQPANAAAGRRSDDPTGAHWDDDTVGQWLDEGDAAERAKRLADPDTRVYKVIEAERAAGEKAESKEPKKREKKPPAKLPEEKSDAKDTQEAAAKMLKRLFNRG